MTPNERPANENGSPREPGLFSTRKRAIESTLSLIGLACLIGFALIVLDAAHWRTVGITIAVMTVCAFIGAAFRWIRTGRA